jgi:hypothetical protein
LERRVFLAGSIEMGQAEQWQQRIVDALSEAGDLVILNPRRDDWDDSWEQRADDPQFSEQVSWELDMLDAADVVVMYLAPGTKSPVSLLELGLCARSGKLRVCCPEGFWRRGNVEMVCRRNRIPLFGTLDDLIMDLRQLRPLPHHGHQDRPGTGPVPTTTMEHRGGHDNNDGALPWLRSPPQNRNADQTYHQHHPTHDPGTRSR